MRKVLNNFPQFKQWDNLENPSGSCNVTSLAMVAWYYGLRGNGKGQLEDQFYVEMEVLKLDRHAPTDLEKFINGKLKPLGVSDRFTSGGSISTIIQSINRNNPVMVHGYFTASGHIVAVCGYDDETLQVLVADPNGEWWKNGYQHEASGRYWMSFERFRSLTDFNGIWMHVFTKG